jgi:hypothetical protein
MAEINLKQIEEARAAMSAPLEERKPVDWSGRYHDSLERLKKKEPRQVWQETTGIKLK